MAPFISCLAHDLFLCPSLPRSPRHLLLGGGGGAAKTGVRNGFEVLELGHDGSKTTAESVATFETESFAVMNQAVAFAPPTKSGGALMGETMVAVGHNESCQVYKARLARRRGADGKANGGSKLSPSQPSYAGLTYVFEAHKKVQTDFGSTEPYQKAVRLSPNRQLMATGGDDGVLRVWTFPELDRTHEIKAHEKEIDDLDFSPDNAKIATISKDRRAFVWDVKKGKKHAELGWDPPKGLKYCFKRIR